MLARREFSLHPPVMRSCLVSVISTLLVAGAEIPASGADEKLTNALAIRSLGAEEAEAQKAVEITGVVIFSDPPATAFVQDESAGTFFRLGGETAPVAGDRVRVRGVTFPGLFLTGIENATFEILSHEALPVPIAATYDDLLSGRLHYQRVSFDGIVRTITPEEEGISKVTLAKGSRILEVRVQAAPSPETPAIDSRVRVSGLAAGHINHRRQLVEPYLRCSGWEEFTTLEAAPPLAGVPLVSPQEILGFSVEGRAENRVRVAGVILAVLERRRLFLRSGESAISIRLLNPEPKLQAGRTVEVIGFPEMDQFSASLVDAAPLHIGSEVDSPAAITVPLRELLEGTYDNDLVSVEGTISDWYRLGEGAVVVLRNRDDTLTASLPEIPEGLSAGITASLTGICRVESTIGTEYRSRPEAISLTLRSAADFTVIRAPKWWNAQRLAYALFAFLAILLVAGLWIFLLRRQVDHQTLALKNSIQHEAALEERQRLAREFHDTLEQDLAGLSLRLDAAGAKSNDATLKEFITGSRRLVSRMQTETRNLVSDLRDSGEGTRSLREALAAIRENLPPGVGPALIWDLAEMDPLPSRTTHHLKMIASEAVTNAIKHAGADTISIASRLNDGTLHLSVSDNGCGIADLSETLGKAGHFGCMGIRERARRIGAEVQWDSPGDGGTTLQLQLPLSNA